MVELRRVRADSLRPHPLNWRIHPEAQQSALRAALQEIGYAQALICRELDDGTLQLLDGHLRADTTPEAEVPIVIVDLDEEEAKKLLLTFDPLTNLAEVHRERMEELNRQVDFDLKELQQLVDGELRRAPKNLKKSADDVPRVEAGDPTSRPGDVWCLGAHRLLCGDSTDPEAILRLMDGRRAKCFNTDPPYGVSYDGTCRITNDKDWSQVFTDTPDLPALLRAMFKAAIPALDPNCPIYIWHDHMQFPAVERAMLDAGLLVHQGIIWQKPLGTFGFSDYRWAHEACLYGWQKGNRPKHVRPHDLSSVWSVDWDGKKRIAQPEHPTQKPVRLFEIPLEQHTEPGDVVLEPFAGSGTQIIAAEKHGRECRAVELSPHFVDVAIRRWQDATGEIATLEGSGETFDALKDNGRD